MHETRLSILAVRVSTRNWKGIKFFLGTRDRWQKPKFVWCMLSATWMLIGWWINFVFSLIFRKCRLAETLCVGRPIPSGLVARGHQRTTPNLVFICMSWSMGQFACITTRRSCCLSRMWVINHDHQQIRIGHNRVSRYTINLNYWPACTQHSKCITTSAFAPRNVCIIGLSFTTYSLLVVGFCTETSLFLRTLAYNLSHIKTL